MSNATPTIERPDFASVKGDVEKAAEYKERVAKLLEPLCQTINEAKREGLEVAFQLQPDAMGRSFVSLLKITKEL